MALAACCPSAPGLARGRTTCSPAGGPENRIAGNGLAAAFCLPDAAICRALGNKEGIRVPSVKTCFFMRQGDVEKQATPCRHGERSVFPAARHATARPSSGRQTLWPPGAPARKKCLMDEAQTAYPYLVMPSQTLLERLPLYLSGVYAYGEPLPQSSSLRADRFSGSLRHARGIH